MTPLTNERERERERERESRLGFTNNSQELNLTTCAVTFEILLSIDEHLK